MCIVELASEKKAVEPVVIDLRGFVSYTDYFVICSGATARQVAAIVDSVKEGLSDDYGVKPVRSEGKGQAAAEWALLDYADLILHVFTAEKRDYYRLEKLWGDAPRVELPALTFKEL